MIKILGLRGGKLRNLQNWAYLKNVDYASGSTYLLWVFSRALAEELRGAITFTEVVL